MSDEEDAIFARLDRCLDRPDVVKSASHALRILCMTSPSVRSRAVKLLQSSLMDGQRCAGAMGVYAALNWQGSMSGVDQVRSALHRHWRHRKVVMRAMRTLSKTLYWRDGRVYLSTHDLCAMREASRRFVHDTKLQYIMLNTLRIACQKNDATLDSITAARFMPVAMAATPRTLDGQYTKAFSEELRYVATCLQRVRAFGLMADVLDFLEEWADVETVANSVSHMRVRGNGILSRLTPWSKWTLRNGECVRHCFLRSVVNALP